VKDNIVTSQLLTTCGSAALRRHKSPFDASVVERLKSSGDAVIGKSNLDEFGMGSHSTSSFFGPVRNKSPYQQYSAGGSSGGSAVAVATGQCQLALGTDTGGSVRLPAAYTGIVGFKPSYGIISRWGVVPYANSLDTVGILGSDVHKVHHFSKNFQNHYDPRDPTSITTKLRQRIKDKIRNKTGSESEEWVPSMELTDMKIGVPIEYNIEELDPLIREAWHRALYKLQAKGCTIIPISLPNTKHALSTYYILAAAEASSNLSKYDGIRYGSRSEAKDKTDDVLYSKTRGDFFGAEVKRRILLGSYTLSSEAVDNYFIQAQKVRRLVQRDFDRIFRRPNPLRPLEQFDLSDMDESIQMDSKLGPAQVDFIICPTAPSFAPALDTIYQQTPVDIYMNDVFTVPASLAGIPALSIPIEIPEEAMRPGIPPFAGIQIIGQYGDDDRLFILGKLLSSLLDKKEMLPIGHVKVKRVLVETDSELMTPSVQVAWRNNQEPLVQIGPKNPQAQEGKVTLKYQLDHALFRNKHFRYTSNRLSKPRIGEQSRKRTNMFPRPMRAIRITKPKVKNIPAGTGPRITKHASPKRESRLPTTQRELEQSFDETFAQWESLVSHKASESQQTSQVVSRDEEGEEARATPARSFMPGDWHCGPEGCGYHNYARNQTCKRCGAPAPEREIPQKLESKLGIPAPPRMGTLSTFRL
jgi:aspartyl-tRNA(Asn)/glutamyl-tRNA(Gln) amidotransferase subunit A